MIGSKVAGQEAVAVTKSTTLKHTTLRKHACYSQAVNVMAAKGDEQVLFDRVHSGDTDIP